VEEHIRQLEFYVRSWESDTVRSLTKTLGEAEGFLREAKLNEAILRKTAICFANIIIQHQRAQSAQSKIVELSEDESTD
jgi:hypothetical protein